MSSTSSSCTRGSSRPYFARASACASASSNPTNTLPSGPYQAGIRCPHQSCREMHQGWMSRIQAKNVFSHCFGTNWVRPVSTASIAGFASTSALAYHCVVSRGSIGTPPRSPCGTWCTCVSVLSNNSSRSSSATISFRAEPEVFNRAISRIASTDSCFALSINEQVFTTRMSAASALGVISAPARSSSPIITSLSTRFFGHPSETNPTLGRLAASRPTRAFSVVISSITALFYRLDRRSADPSRFARRQA